MSRTLFLQVEPAKTSTSAIQTYFQANEFESLCYPETERLPDGSHLKLIFASRGVNRYGDIGIPQWPQLLAELTDELSAPSKNVLISY